MKSKLLVVELWGLGDLVIATPFLQAASERYDVTLVAKPYAQELGKRLWPGVQVLPFVAPWTAFHHKYQVLRWPWREFAGLRKRCAQGFEVGLSARWDPRDHALLAWLRARRRLGYARVGSSLVLTERLDRPERLSHRYESWRWMARHLGWELPVREKLGGAERPRRQEVLVHSGAAQAVRVWPLERYRVVVERLRQRQHQVQVVCDANQRRWWVAAGESGVATPQTVSELLGLIDRAGAFMGNDSGPSHLAACCGVPTFTLFGPQLTEWFAPLGPAAEWLEGKPCRYKPCSDYCRFPEPFCLTRAEVEEVWARVEPFVEKHLAR